MKKTLLVLVFAILILLTGCTNNDDFTESLEGKYVVTQCVYLSMLSSATPDYYTEKYAGVLYIEFTDDKINYYGTDESLKTYDDIIFKQVNLNKGLDDLVSYDVSDILNLFVYRYDIYSGDTSIALTIFEGNDKIYLSETETYGTNNAFFAFWNIFEIEKVVEVTN